jgi:hypothetical protein
MDAAVAVAHRDPVRKGGHRGDGVLRATGGRGDSADNDSGRAPDEPATRGRLLEYADALHVGSWCQPRQQQEARRAARLPNPIHRLRRSRSSRERRGDGPTSQTPVRASFTSVKARMAKP